ncbi:serine/threonine-protein kinase [Actinomadura geliboluensis]|uniref:serine/threonine-protein kinase n=1 Tax=Actinomadura geliboluensis TaxID=882440 RepID=UPI00371961E8
MPNADGELATGDELSHYLLAEEIGRGGMGVVFRAVDRDLDREVAIKVMAERATTGRKARERFVREARTLARINHSHVLPIYEIKDHEGRLYLATRMIPFGHTLRGLLRARTRLAPGHALRLLEQIGDALDAMHRAGVLHLDLKPENILLEGPEGDEHPWLADFGLARTRGDETTWTDGIAGTVAYMAPEQLAGTGDIGPRADLYALALVLFETLTGRQLDFVQRSGVPGTLPADELLTDRLRTVFGRALAPVAADRYESAGMFLADAREALSRAPAGAGAGRARGHTTTAPPAPRNSLAGAPGKRPKRHRWAVAAVAVVAVAATMAVLVPVLLIQRGDGGTKRSATAPAAPSPTAANTTKPSSQPSTPPSPRRQAPAPAAPTTSRPPSVAVTPPPPPADSTRLTVCADTLRVRAAPESVKETATVATLIRGQTFVVEVVQDAIWVRGHSPEVPAARGWVLRRYLQHACR